MKVVLNERYVLGFRFDVDLYFLYSNELHV